MMKVCYSELDGPEGLSCRLEAAGHAGFAPAGQDIVCAGASTLMQALVYLLAGEENAHADAWEEPDGPRLAVQADAPCAAWVQGAFELAKAGFTLLAERYPDNIRFADVSRRGEQSMMDLQMFAEEAAPAAPALSPAQARQAVASGTMEPGEKTAQPVPEAKPDPEPTEPETPQPELPRPAVPPLPLQARNAVRELHARWAAEEADLRRSQPEFRLQEELKEISGNRDMTQGGTTGGVTAASAIAALQEAGSKLSRDMLKSAYRAFSRQCYLMIELMRQFYDEQRIFRIVGPSGENQFLPFSAAALRPQPVREVGGVELGCREPIFDIVVSAAKKSTFSRLSQNETAKECYQLGFFDPANADAALAALEMMDFEGIEKVRQRVRQNGTLAQKLVQLQQAVPPQTGTGGAVLPGSLPVAAAARAMNVKL